MEENIDHSLQLLGLAKNERKIYVDLIKNGKSAVLPIAKRTTIYRTNVYDALRRLLQKGFIFELVEEDKHLFMACDPSRIVEYVDQIKQEAEAIIPSLLNIANKSDNQENESVTMSTGTISIRGALLSLLELNAPINVLGASTYALEIFGMNFMNDFHKRRIKKKIIMNHVYDEDMPERIKILSDMKYTSARHLPAKHKSVVSIIICGDRVLFNIWTSPATLINIKNKRIANEYHNYFDILWKSSVK